MLSAKDVSAIYETLLSSPGMNDEVKVSIKLTRKNVLILTKIIELGLSSKNGNEGDGLFTSVNGNALDEIKNLSGEILSKSGLSEMYQKLNSLQLKQ